MNKRIVMLCLLMTPFFVHAQKAPIILSCQMEGQEKPNLIKILVEGDKTSWQFWYEEKLSWGSNDCNTSGATPEGAKYKNICDFSPGQFQLTRLWEGGGKSAYTWNDYIIDRTKGEFIIIQMIYDVRNGLRKASDVAPDKSIGRCQKGVEPAAAKTQF